LRHCAASIWTKSHIDDDNRRQTIFVCELWREGEQLQRAIATFAPTKHLALEDPQMEVETEQAGSELRIRLQTASLARFVELALEGVEVIFSDNCFDLPAKRAVNLSCPLPEGWTLDAATKALRIRSVFDSF
jgi:beta-mannosidase